MDIEKVIESAFCDSQNDEAGEPASYIPELAKVDADLFGIAVCTTDGNLFTRGDALEPFTLQSISKVLAYSCALESFSEEEIIKRVGTEASGEMYNSIIKLDRDGKAFNPMVNAGAIAITDMLVSRFGEQAIDSTLAFFSAFLGKNKVTIDQRIFLSESATGEKNRAIAHLLKNYNLLDNSVETVLDLYFRHCSVLVTSVDLAQMGASLANHGKNFMTGRDVVSPGNVQRVLSLMLTCGMYNNAGRWVYEVGLPSKSGVSGGLLSVSPGILGIGAYSPKIDLGGSGVKGSRAIKKLADDLGLHIFNCD